MDKTWYVWKLNMINKIKDLYFKLKIEKLGTVFRFVKKEDPVIFLKTFFKIRIQLKFDGFAIVTLPKILVSRIICNVYGTVVIKSWKLW